MSNLTRRSVLRGSLAWLRPGPWRGPISPTPRRRPRPCGGCRASPRRKTSSFKKIVADYEKASGNTIDYSIVPYAPMRQKIVSAMTSGVVPDLFQNTPAEIIALYAWDDKLVDVSDVVETQERNTPRPRCSPSTATTTSRKSAAFTACPIPSARLPNHIWRPLVEKAGYKIEDIPKTWDAYLRFLQGGAEEIARAGHAQRLWPRFSGDHQRQRPQHTCSTIS